MNITKALEIEGWTSAEELMWLAQQASKRRRIVEVGSWRGRSAVAMAENTKGTVYCVDTFNGTSEAEHGAYFAGKPSDFIYKEFVANTDHLDNIRTFRKHSVVQASLFRVANVRFDMIFIDADHSYEGVKADIINWRPLLAPGGLLCGHDYSGEFPGVTRALKELLKNWTGVKVGSLWMQKNR